MSKYVTQTGTLVADEEDDFSYDKVDVQAVVPGNAHLEQPDDKLDLIVRNTLTTRSADEQGEKKKQENVASAGTAAPATRCPTPEEFVRLFLCQMGLLRTLDTFEEEWSCRLPDIERLHLSTTVDDALQRNTVLVEAAQRASEEVQRLKQELQSSHKSQDTLRKERDFHKMHHQRVIQEKAQIGGSLRRLEQQTEQQMAPYIERLRAEAMRDADAAQQETRRLTAALHSAGLCIMEEATTSRSGTTSTGIRECYSLTRIDTEQPPIAITPDREHGGWVQRERWASEREPMPMDKLMMLRSWQNDSNGDNAMTNESDLQDICVTSVVAHQSKALAVTAAGADGLWRLWSTETGAKVMEQRRDTTVPRSSSRHHADHPVGVGRCAFVGSAEGTRVITAQSWTGEMGVWDLARGERIGTLPAVGGSGGGSGGVWGLREAVGGGGVVGTASADGLGRVWDVERGIVTSVLVGHVASSRVLSLDFRGGSTTEMCTTAQDGAVCVWDTRMAASSATTSECTCSAPVMRLVGAKRRVPCVDAVCVRGGGVVVGDAEGIVRLWDLRNGRSSVIGEVSEGAVNQLAVDSSGSLVAAAGASGKVHVWRVTGVGASECPLSYAGHTAAVHSIAFDSYHSGLLSATGDGLVALWA